MRLGHGMGMPASRDLTLRTPKGASATSLSAPRIAAGDLVSLETAAFGAAQPVARGKRGVSQEKISRGARQGFARVVVGSSMAVINPDTTSIRVFPRPRPPPDASRSPCARPSGQYMIAGFRDAGGPPLGQGGRKGLLHRFLGHRSDDRDGPMQ